MDLFSNSIPNVFKFRPLIFLKRTIKLNRLKFTVAEAVISISLKIEIVIKFQSIKQF